MNKFPSPLGVQGFSTLLTIHAKCDYARTTIYNPTTNHTPINLLNNFTKRKDSPLPPNDRRNTYQIQALYMSQIFYIFERCLLYCNNATKT